MKLNVRQACEWLGVCIRLIGVYCILFAIAWFKACVELQMGITPVHALGAFDSGPYVPSSYFAVGVARLGLGVALLTFGGRLASWMFRAPGPIADA